MIFRDLLRSEIEKMREIDRSELIEKIYYHKKGKLVLENEFYDMKGFPPGELEALITRQYAIYDQGGCIFGAFDENKLVGIASINNKPFGVMKKTLKMDILFVSHAYRGQKIAVTLMEMARKKAIDRCAEKIYISATPSEHTVNFYMRCGAVLTTELDEALFGLEPEDIHLELSVKKTMTTYYLVRHGEPDWELNERHGLKGHGRDLPPLTEIGVLQAKKVSLDKRLQDSQIIICSPYTRAMHTAAIISKETGIDLNVEFDLREWQPDLSFNFDNMQLLKELTDDYETHNGIHPEGQTPVWETKEMMKNRIEGVLKKYKDYSKVIVVGHGMIFRTLIECEDIPNCSVFELVK